MKITLVCSSLLFVSMACGGQKLDIGASKTADAEAPRLPDAGGSTTDPTTPSSFSAAEVADAQRRCQAPHGTVDAPATVGDFKRRFVGAWYTCNPAGNWVPRSSVGIVFLANGRYVALLENGDGLVQATGIDSEGAYALAPENHRTMGEADTVVIAQMWVWFPWPQRIEFEAGPGRMRMAGTENVGATWYVPLGRID